MGIADNRTVKAYAVYQNMNMRMFGVRMTADKILIVGKAHIFQPSVCNFAPVTVRKVFVRVQAYAYMARSEERRVGKEC